MQRSRFPARQLNSRTIKSAALGYLSPIFLGKCSILSARCVCKVQEDGFEKAWNNVCRTRDACDSALKGLFAFFVISMVFSTCWVDEIHQFLLINKFCFLHFSGMKNVAFFLSAITTQRLKKQRDKQKTNEEHEESDDTEECADASQLAASSSQEWLKNHASIISEKMCPGVSYWIALTTPNGAPTSPLAIHRALLECSVDVFTNQVWKKNVNSPIRNLTTLVSYTKRVNFKLYTFKSSE